MFRHFSILIWRWCSQDLLRHVYSVLFHSEQLCELMLEPNKSMLLPGCTNPWCYLFTQVIKFCTVAPHIFTINFAFYSLLTHKNVYQFTCTGQKVPSNSEAHRSVQNCRVIFGFTSHLSGNQNLGVTPTFLENMWISVVQQFSQLAANSQMFGKSSIKSMQEFSVIICLFFWQHPLQHCNTKYSYL